MGVHRVKLLFGTILMLAVFFLVVTGCGSRPSVDLMAVPEEGGTISGGGTFDEGEHIRVEAEPAVGYRFVKWTDGDKQVSGDPVYHFTLAAGRQLTAHFEQLTYTVRPTVTANGNRGMVTGGGEYTHGQQAVIRAFPAGESRFEGWYSGGKRISGEPEYAFTVTGEKSLSARFLYEEEIWINSLVDKGLTPLAVMETVREKMDSLETEEERDRLFRFLLTWLDGEGRRHKLVDVLFHHDADMHERLGLPGSYEDFLSGKGFVRMRDLLMKTIEQDPGAIEDRDLRESLTGMWNQGFTLKTGEGSFSSVVDYSRLKESFQPLLSPGMHAYLGLRNDMLHAMSEGYMLISPEEHSRLLIRVDGFLSGNPELPEAVEVEGKYETFLAMFLVRDPFVPSVSPEEISAYRDLVREYPQTRTAGVLKDYLSVLEENNRQIDEQVWSFLRGQGLSHPL